MLRLLCIKFQHLCNFSQKVPWSKSKRQPWPWLDVIPSSWSRLLPQPPINIWFSHHITNVYRRIFKKTTVLLLPRIQALLTNILFTYATCMFCPTLYATTNKWLYIYLSGLNSSGCENCVRPMTWRVAVTEVPLGILYPWMTRSDCAVLTAIPVAVCSRWDSLRRAAR